ncbi:MAG: hypothetical protein JWN99_1443 [Ilumatobacteraceae bacterium]|nr:hypothetical protein [Ilumatobacteraceae bacterium]
MNRESDRGQDAAAAPRGRGRDRAGRRAPLEMPDRGRVRLRRARLVTPAHGEHVVAVGRLGSTRSQLVELRTIVAFDEPLEFGAQWLDISSRCPSPHCARGVLRLRVSPHGWCLNEVTRRNTSPSQVPTRLAIRCPTVSDRAIAMSLIGVMEPVRPRTISGLRLRRAILGVLLVEDGPMSIDQITSVLAQRGLSAPTTPRRTQRKAVADVLRYQSTLGRVVRVERGVYEAVRHSISRSMRDRSIRALSGDERRGAAAVSAWVDPGSPASAGTARRRPDR